MGLMILSLVVGMIPARTFAAQNPYLQFELALPFGAGRVCTEGFEALQSGRFAEAEASFRKVLGLLQKHADPHPFETGLINCWLGHVLVEQHRYVEGETVLRQGLAGLRSEAGRSSNTTAKAGVSYVEATATVGLGLALYGQHRYAEAEVDFTEAMSRLERLPVSPDKDVERACFFLGCSLDELGRPAEAERWLRQALQHCERVSPEKCENLFVNLWSLSKALAAQQKYEEAERCLRRAMTLYEEETPDQASGDPGTVNLATALGKVLLEQGRAKEAQPYLERAVSFHSKKGFEKDIRTQNAARELARCLRTQGQISEAEKLLRRHGVDPTTGLAEAGVQPDTLRSRAVAIQSGRLEKAIPAKVLKEATRGLDAYGSGQFGQAEKILTGVLQQVQSSSRMPPHLVAQFQVYLGDSLIEQRRYADAEPHLRSALKAQEAIVQKQGKNPDPADLVYLCRTKLRLGLALHGQKRYPEAVERFVQGLNLADELGLEDPAIASSRMFLGEDLFNLEKYIQAEDQYRRAVQICVMYHVPEDLHVYVSSRVGVARSVFERQRYAEAIPLLERAIPLAERSEDMRSNPKLMVSLVWSQGTSLRNAGRPADAETVFRRDLPKVEKQFGAQSTEAAFFHEGLGLSLKELKRSEEAEVHLRQAAQIRRVIAPDDENTAETFLVHAGVLESLGRHQDAVGVYQDAVTLLERPGIQAPEALGRALEGLGQALRAAGRDSEARAVDRKRQALDQGP